MKQRLIFVFVTCMYFSPVQAWTESFRALVAGSMDLSSSNPEGSSVNLGSNGSALIRLGRDTRFLRGIELELTAPQSWLAYRGSLAMLVYDELDHQPSRGINDLEARRVSFDPLPNKVKTIYQLPIRATHGLRTSPYAAVLPGIVLPSSFPILVRLTAIIKGINEELENMIFTLTAKPIFSDEGAVKINYRYPQQLRGRPFTVLIDDVVIENSAEERLLREGEHHLVVLSEDYRNESRRFMVERGKTIDLVIDLQDPTPLIIFESPENARIFLNNNPVSRENGPIPVEPGTHEARFQIGDYTITKIINVQRGKTYKVAVSVGIDIDESD
jgi:hypothetical protein